MVLSAAIGVLILALFLFLWYRTLAGLPSRRQPEFIRRGAVKWGIPLLCLALFLAGLALAAAASPAAAATAAAACAGVAWAAIRFDRHTAEMRAMHARYREILEANPGMNEAEALFHTAQWRYPDWVHDRLVELVAGKDIEALILLVLVHDNDINPISDWELYRSLKRKAAGIAGSTKRGGNVKMIMTVFTLGLAMLAALPAGRGARAQEKAKEAPPAPLPNFLELSPRVGTGGQPTQEGMRDLAAKGYQSIINVRMSGEKVDLAAEEKLALGLGMKYFMIPFDGSQPSEKQAQAFLQVMSALKEDRVFVHCAGANRVGALMMMHLSLQEGVPVQQAEETARRIGMRPGPMVDFAKKMIEKGGAR